MEIRRFIAVCGALLFIGSSSLSLVAQDKKPQQPKLTKQEEQDRDALVKLVNAVSAGQPAPNQMAVAWVQNHFLKLDSASGKTYAAFAVSVSGQSSPVSLYLRAMPKGAVGSDKDKKATFPWEDLFFFDVPADGRVARAINVPPGDYDLYFAVKEQSTGKKGEASKVGLLKKDLSIPDLSGAALSTSSVILASGIEETQPLPLEQARVSPYTLGAMKITPAGPDGKLSAAGALNVVYWIYGATPVAGKPDLQIEYNFHQRLADGEKFFNKTAPQAMNASQVPPNFDLAAGHLLTMQQSVPLKSFPPGNYRLEIKITDKPSGKSITQNVNFTVTA